MSRGSVVVLETGEGRVFLGTSLCGSDLRRAVREALRLFPPTPGDGGEVAAGLAAQLALQGRLASVSTSRPHNECPEVHVDVAGMEVREVEAIWTDHGWFERVSCSWTVEAFLAGLDPVSIGDDSATTGVPQ